MAKYDEILDLIYEKSPLQKKKIQKYLSANDREFFIDFEKFANDFMRYLNHENIPLNRAVSSYLELCQNMIVWQKKFLRTGVYPTESSDTALNQVYNNKETMVPYMTGLAISQFLWRNHYRIYKFFLNYLKNHQKDISTYMEIGPGHGLFLLNALDFLSEKTIIYVVDISQTSIDMTGSLIKYFCPSRQNIVFVTSDILQFDTTIRFDFITMGEVIEHVNHPEALLSKLFTLLKPDGRAFISTCANCPAIDHVFQFETVGEIHELIHSCNFEIVDELLLPAEDLPVEEAVRQKITINYCAILRRRS